MLLQYAGASAVAPVAHALLSDDRAQAATHWEAAGDKSCPPVHQHINCPAFNGARLLAAPAPVIRLPDGQDIAGFVAPASIRVAPRPAEFSPLGSRAPPLV